MGVNKRPTKGRSPLPPRIIRRNHFLLGTGVKSFCDSTRRIHHLYRNIVASLRCLKVVREKLVYQFDETCPSTRAPLADLRVRYIMKSREDQPRFATFSRHLTPLSCLRRTFSRTLQNLRHHTDQIVRLLYCRSSNEDQMSRQAKILSTVFQVYMIIQLLSCGAFQRHCCRASSKARCCAHHGFRSYSRMLDTSTRGAAWKQDFRRASKSSCAFAGQQGSGQI